MYDSANAPAFPSITCDFTILNYHNNIDNQLCWYDSTAMLFLLFLFLQNNKIYIHGKETHILKIINTFMQQTLYLLQVNFLQRWINLIHLDLKIFIFFVVFIPLYKISIALACHLPNWKKNINAYIYWR